MMLYDVYYKNSEAMDSDVPLPPAQPDIKCAVNTNWDRHTKVPVRDGDGWTWKTQTEVKS